MMRMKNKLIIAVLAATVLSTVSCKKYLDINTDPDTTQVPSNSSVFPAMLAAIPRGIQYDARYLGKYIQNWLTSGANNQDTWDLQGYVWNATDISGDIWRQTYYGLGKNLEYIITNGLQKGQNDYVGAAMVLKALMFQMSTDYNGEIIWTEAFQEGKVYFKYDEQQVVYQGIDSLCRAAISYLEKAEQTVGSNTLKIGDYSYNGDVTKWKRLAYGILARNYGHLTNKASYKPDSVIKFVNNAMVNGNDDFLIPFDATKNDDTNFFGTYRNNLGSFRQSNFIVKLLDGTTLAGSSVKANRDPRLPHLLSASQDTTNGNGGYRGVDPGFGDPYSAVTTGANAPKRVAVLWGDSIYNNPSASAFSTSTGKYLFKDKAVLPVMTYAEMQFLKAEAAFRKGDKNMAYGAYLEGINAHFDFINRNYGSLRGASNIYNGSPISSAQRAAYLASPNVKHSAATLTLTDIMLQKYIALWGWGFVETWVDLRRYHYIDLDPATGEQVFKNFTLPKFPSSNLGKPVYRVRPRFNSEQVWNYDELKRFGGDKVDYHTYEMWFSLP